ncbi:MAG: substrate-binding domain-containing protein [Sutterellaceae bacterium]|nr:substrate-binding domain-containing protein [Sutterellaceae bacterium]MDY2868460.1 substrate-binding domain-containing protein [Mesosutterella sp.]
MTSTNPLSVFASHSLRRALPTICREFEKRSGVEVKILFGHSGALRTEIEGNLACDIFCSADTANPKALVTAMKASRVFPYASNSLIIVTRNERRFQNSTWLDVLCDPSIAIGTSTPKVSSEGDWTRSLFQNVARDYPGEIGAGIIGQHSVALVGGNRTGEDLDQETEAGFILKHGVDAAVVYASERRAVEKEGLKVYAIPEKTAPRIVYGACHPRSGKSPAKLCREFEEFLISACARAELAKDGFLPPAKP